MSDLRADVEAAFQSVSEQAPAVEAPAAPEAPPSPAPEATPSAPEPAQEGAQERPRDERGRFAKETAPPLPEKVPAGAQPPKMAPQTPPPEAAAKPPQETVRAPQSWKPTVRELFAKLPPEVQQEVIRRERESERILQESAQARNGFQRFQETIAPYEPILRAQGEPLQVLGGLLQTVAVLSSAPAPMKAQALARVIQAYGVDVGMLADALQGQPMAQPQQQWQQPQEFRDPRVDQLLAQREQMLSRKAEEGIREIQQEEFFEDVRDLMADILDGAAARGVAMSAKEAYNRAIWADPEISRVLTQRREAAQAGTGVAATQRAQIAASSVQGRPTVSVGSKTQSGASLRDDIMAAIDRLQEE